MLTLIAINNKDTKMIKKSIISLLLIAGLWCSAASQTDNRSRETKIADIVMLLPADNSALFNRLMSELYALGNVARDLAPRLSAEGGGDTQLRYAIAGLATCASQKPELRSAVARDLCAALATVSDIRVRDFLLIQLQYVAGDESVETVAGYLSDDRLCDPAARVLLRVGTPAALRALLAALKTANDAGKLTLAQALGQAAYADALPEITAMLSSLEPRLRKTALRALASIASPTSEKLLADAAARVEYRAEPTEALQSYLDYLKKRLDADTNRKTAENVMKASKLIIDVATDAGRVATRTAAMNLFIDAATKGDAESRAVKEVVAAMKSPDRRYRRAVLDASLRLQRTSAMYDALTAMLKRESNPEVKADLVYALGVRGVAELKSTGQSSVRNPLPLLVASLTGANPSVAVEAIEAVGKLYKLSPATATANCIPAVIAAMNAGAGEAAATGGAVLKSIAAKSLTDDVAAALPKASRVEAKIALIDILASRKASDRFETVVEALAPDASPALRLAAYRAMKELATEKDAPAIARILNTSTNSEETAALQDALFASVSKLPQTDATRRIVGLLKTGRNPAPYYRVLAMTGGDEALRVTRLGLDGADSDRAFDALAEWSDASAMSTLFDIATGKPKYAERALNSYANLVGKSSMRPEQKLLLLRKALDATKSPELNNAAKSSELKRQIIRQMSRTGVFAALTTTGACLDDPDPAVRQAAVQAVRTIALAHPAFYGRTVTGLLNKAIALNTDSEAEYQKQEILKHLASLPSDDGFVSLFNGHSLDGWKGLVENPVARSKMKPAELAKKQTKADELMRSGWTVEKGTLIFTGKGDNLCTEKQYGDFEMYVDWRLDPTGSDADAGIYLRGSPQVQIWDTARRNVGAQVGSGGLYNNKVHESKPKLVADNRLGEWNSFYIRMIGDKVLVRLNGQTVTDNVTLENYWDRSIPIFPTEQIELQAHGTRVEYRDIYIREIRRPAPYEVSPTEKAEGFVPLFNGMNMNGWTGNLTDYIPEGGVIKCIPANRGHGNLYTERDYSDFVLRFEFKLTPAANNGLGIRTPPEGDAAYVGMELQILDNEAEVYKDLEEYQYHGSVYGVIAAKRGYLKPTGEWNVQEVVAHGNRIKVTLNGTVILDGDIAEASRNFTATRDGKQHPGLSNKSGRIAFLGHGSELEFRNIRIKSSD
jgi:hypothetical protein